MPFNIKARCPNCKNVLDVRVNDIKSYGEIIKVVENEQTNNSQNEQNN